MWRNNSNYGANHFNQVPFCHWVMSLNNSFMFFYVFIFLDWNIRYDNYQLKFNHQPSALYWSRKTPRGKSVYIRSFIHVVTYLTELRLIGRWKILCTFKSELAKTNLLTRFNCDLNRSNILCDAIALRSGPQCCYCLTQHEWEKI